MNQTAAPGWYQADGDFDGVERYWDGAQWSVDTRPGPDPADLSAGDLNRLSEANPSAEELTAALIAPGSRRGPGPCDICGRNPAQYVKYSGVTGLLLARSNWSSQGRFCVACSSGQFRKVQSKLMLTGWWSLTSFLIAPFLLFANVARLGRHRRTLAPSHVVDRELDRQLAGRPLILRAGPLVIAAFALVATVNSIISSPPDAVGAENTPAMVARTSLAIGDCFNMDSDFAIPDDVTPRPCAELHGFELYGLHELDAGPFPGRESVDKSGVDYCIPLFTTYVGIDYDDSIYEVEYLFPTELGWAGGDRVIECLIAGDGTGTGLVGSAQAAGY